MKKLFVSIIVLFFLLCYSVEAAQPKRIIQINVKSEMFNMIYVEPGTFTMGAMSDVDYDEREHPAHKVTLTHGYYIGETEVTQALWEAVMENNPSEFKGKNKPVDYVNWDDCQAFVSILSAMTGRKFRLPSEAEWEYAAKGGKKSKGYIYSGSNNIDDVAWYVVNSGDKTMKDKTYVFGPENNSQTHDVKMKNPNELGIYDMTGNVSEWCEDGYAEYNLGMQYDPNRNASNNSKVKRGGDFNSRSRHCRTTFRVGFESTFCMSTYGFRIVMDE